MSVVRHEIGAGIGRMSSTRGAAASDLRVGRVSFPGGSPPPSASVAPRHDGALDLRAGYVCGGRIVAGICERCSSPATSAGGRCNRLFPHPRPACTGITAAWCPIHGDCTCPAANESGDRTLDSADCPLHSVDSDHAERAEDAGVGLGSAPVQGEELLAAQLANARLRDGLESLLPRLTDSRGHCLVCDARRHQEADRVDCPFAALSAPPPSLAELRELVAAAMDLDKVEGADPAAWAMARYDAALAAVLVAHPYLKE